MIRKNKNNFAHKVMDDQFHLNMPEDQTELS